MKKNLVLSVYSLWGLLSLVLLILFNLAPGASSVSLFALIFGLLFFLLPGWLLNRFLKIWIREFSGQILINFALSLGYYLILNLLAMILGLNITELVLLNLILIISLFGIALTYDLRTHPEYCLKWRLDWSLAIYILPILLCFVIVFFVDGQGANFNGDPYYHLAIIRKAVENLSLNIKNLAYSQSTANNPAYILPAWHLIIALYSKIIRIDIFSAWSKINLTLLVILFFTYYYFIKKLFSNQLLVISCFLVSLFFLFYAGPGYFFARLPVPDSLAQFILLPLVLSFSVVFIFEKNKKILWPWLTIVLALFDIHAIHYFYYFFILLVFAILFSLISLFRERATLKALWSLVLLNFLILVVAGLIFQITSGLVFENLVAFFSAPIYEISYPTFVSFPMTFKIGLVLLPLIFLLAKNRRTLILPAGFLLALVVYWTPLKQWSIKIFSYIFTDRLLANVAWYYLVFGAAFGGIFLLIESFFKTIKAKKRLGLASLFLVIILLILELIFHPFAHLVYQIFYAKPTVEQNYSWALPGFVISSLILLIFWQKFIKKDLWSREGKNISYYLACSVFVFLFFFSIVYPDFAKQWSFRFLTPNQINPAAAFGIDLNNEENFLQFIKEKIPSKSTILANADVSRNFPLFVDDYVVYYQGMDWADKFQKVFQGEFSLDVGKEIINDPKYKVNYIVVSPIDQIDLVNDLHYQLIYDREVKIYQKLR